MSEKDYQAEYEAMEKSINDEIEEALLDSDLEFTRKNRKKVSNAMLYEMEKNYREVTAKEAIVIIKRNEAFLKDL